MADDLVEQELTRRLRQRIRATDPSRGDPDGDPSTYVHLHERLRAALERLDEVTGPLDRTDAGSVLSPGRQGQPPHA